MSATPRPLTTEELVAMHELLRQVEQEYRVARTKFGTFSSPHEGLAVIWEEFEEVKVLVFGKNYADRGHDAREECIQLAAMALAFAVELT